ncbi:MAG: carboxypeptidase-like regulatory domain-containing protein [Planctomycetota bacterium]
MRRTVVTVLAIALAAVALVFLLEGRASRDAADLAASGSSSARGASGVELEDVGDAARDVREEPVAVGALVEQQATAEEGAETAGAELRVRVVDENGAPLAGVRVRAAVADVRTSPVETSDDAGVASFRMDGAFTVYALDTRPTETLAAAYARLRQTVRAGAVLEFELRVPSGHTVSGRVVDEAGDPVPGASVRGWCRHGPYGEPARTVLCASDGTFRIDHLGDELWVEASREGLAPSNAFSATEELDKDIEGVELVLVAAVTLPVEVVDTFDRPIADASVRIGIEGPGEPTAWRYVTEMRPGEVGGRTDANGRLEFEGLAPRSYRVDVTCEGYTDFRERLVADGTTQRVVLDAGFVVTGRVVDRAGLPVEGASVRGGPDAFGRALRGGDTTDATGAFRVFGIQESPRMGIEPFVVVTHEDYASEVVQPVPYARDGSAEPVTVVLSPGLAISGRVVLPDGTPAGTAGIWVVGSRMAKATLFDREPSYEAIAATEESTTAADGSFRITGLVDETYTVKVRKNEDLGGGRPFEFQVDAGSEGVELVLDPDDVPGLVVRGVVRDAVSGAPLEDFRVSSGSTEAERLGDGRYVIRGLNTRWVNLWITAPGYADRTFDERDVEGDELERDFALVPSCDVVVRIVDTDGRPWGPSATLTLEAPKGALVPYEMRWCLRGEDMRLEDLPRIPLEGAVLVPGSATPVTLDLTHPPDGAIEFVVPGPTQHDVQLVVLEVDASVDADEVARRSASEEDVDREWIEGLRRDGLLSDCASGSMFTLYAAGDLRPVTGSLVGGDGGFQLWLSTNQRALVDRACVELELAEATWVVDVRAMDEPERRAEFRVVLGPDGPDTWYAVLPR